MLTHQHLFSFQYGLHTQPPLDEIDFFFCHVCEFFLFVLKSATTRRKQSMHLQRLSNEPEQEKQNTNYRKQIRGQKKPRRRRRTHIHFHSNVLNVKLIIVLT